MLHAVLRPAADQPHLIELALSNHGKGSAHAVRLSAEPVAATLARGETTVVVRSTEAAEFGRLLTRHDVDVSVDGDRLTATGTTLTTVSQLAYDHRIQVLEITEASRSLEEILLDITGSTAEFAAA